MRREDIRLLAQARQGDAQARCELGRRYLVGCDGFARHVAMGVEHLRQPNVAALPRAACLLAECLGLHELVQMDLLPELARAAAAGSAVAQLRLGLWQCLRLQTASGRGWLARAATAGNDAAQRALAAFDRGDDDGARLQGLVDTLHRDGDIDGPAVTMLAVQQALQAGELLALQAALAARLALAPEGIGSDAGPTIDRELSTLLSAAVALAEARSTPLAGLPPAALRQALELRAAQGDRDAAYTLGRSLCGIACPGLHASVYGGHTNMRKGAAFLLRAADAGCEDAWMHLYRLHADHRLSVANPQLARFFLEKAAQRGRAAAQRRLGALILREATVLDESEQAIHWLWQAAAQGDEHARNLLASLVLPVAGSEAEAAWALDQVRAVDPWLAARLAVARHFGLTRLEALSINPAEGLRPWGLVVGRNPFIVQARLAAPRAVPALNPAAREAAQRAATLFAQAGSEGDLRSRSSRQRRLLDRLGIDDELFFSDANSMTLESLRLGAKWAWRARQPLRDALAA